MILLSLIWHRFGSEKGYSPACWLDSKSGRGIKTNANLEGSGEAVRKCKDILHRNT